MASWTFRQAFWVTTAVQILASSFDLVIVKRWNLQVGVSDELAYLFGDAMVQQLSSMLQMMPMALLTSRMCPRGAEATVYAILAGFQNFGCSVSSVLGVWLTQSLGVETSGAADPLGSCDFSNLGTAIAVAHLALPLLSVPLTFLLVPAVRMDDDLAFSDRSPLPSFPPSPRSPTASEAGSLVGDCEGARYARMEDSDLDDAGKGGRAGSPHFDIVFYNGRSNSTD